MEALAGLAATSGTGVGLLTILVRLFVQWREDRRERYLQRKSINQFNAKVISEARNYNPISAIAARFMMLSTSLGMLVFITIYGALNPDLIIHFPVEREGFKFSLLFLELEIPRDISWRTFAGLVILPTWFMIIGASVGFFFGRAMTER